MLTDIAASLFAKAINTSATCIYSYATTSICEESLYINFIVWDMQHLRCKQQALKKSQLYCQKRMCFGRWHHFCDNTNIFNPIGNINYKQILMLLLGRHCGQLNTTTTDKNILIKRLKRLNIRTNYKNNNFKGFRGSGDILMKLLRASSSMFNNKMMCV